MYSHAKRIARRILNLLLLTRPGPNAGAVNKRAHGQENYCAQILLIKTKTKIENAEPAERTIQSLLTRWNYRVTAVQSAATALQALQTLTRGPDLLICDYRKVEKNNGLTVMNDLRKQLVLQVPGIVIIDDITTIDPSDIQQAKQDAVLVLRKPVRPARLRSAIRFCLRYGHSLAG